MTGIPVVIDGASVTALIVGGGRVGTRRAMSFLTAGAAVVVVAPVISDTLTREERATSRLTLLRRRYSADDIQVATLVVASTNDRALNSRIAGDARKAHRLVSVADAPDECTLVMATAHRVGQLVIGVMAGGVPRAAMRIRDAIAERFDTRYGEALNALSRVRRAALDAGEGAVWHDSLDRLIGEDFCRNVEDGVLIHRLNQWR
ncbi:MAG: hypothetical protein NVS1B4_07910 [Gemmatimonadaceae bacterium]